jgi:Family of unknown function (DUF6326)
MQTLTGSFRELSVKAHARVTPGSALRAAVQLLAAHGVLEGDSEQSQYSEGEPMQNLESSTSLSGVSLRLAAVHDIKGRLSLLWLFALLNYLYADVVALFDIAGSRNPFGPLPPWALMGSAVLMEIPIAMILACHLLPFRVNRLANIIAGVVLTLVNGYLTFVAPLVVTGARTPAYPEYLFFATIETVATSVIVWKAWTWSRVEGSV